MKTISKFMLVFFLLDLSACQTDATLVPLASKILAPNQFATATMNFCGGGVPSTETLLKFIFVVDTSGVNQSYDGQSSVGTDSNGDLRYGTIVSFLQDQANNPEAYFALVNFNTTAGVASTSSGSALATVGFQQNAPFETLIQTQWHANHGLPNDSGWSNYESALTAVNNLLIQDITQARLNPNNPVSAYFIVFISGGEPLLSWVATPPPGGTYTKQDDGPGKTAIQNQIVTSILAHQAGDSDVVESIIFDTAYYYTAQTFNASALQMLELMANWGNGFNMLLGQGIPIDFSKFTMPQFNYERTLKDVFVINENAIWWGGQLMQDSDNDGLPDAIELQLGSDPNNPDSDGDGISDGVQYYATGKVCQQMTTGGTCAPAVPSSTCSQFILAEAPILKIKDSDGDGLNDCEEQLLTSSSSLWDTNLDWIPDRLALRAGIAFLAGSDDTLSDPDNDGITNYFEVKNFTPPLTNNAQIVNLHPYQYTLTMTSNADATPVCYNLSISNITYFSSTDSIRAYVLESTGGKSSQRYMRTVAKPLNNASVDFEDSDLGSPIGQ
jgi:hypothetical protein